MAPKTRFLQIFGYKILSLNFVQNDKDEMLRLNLSRNKGKYAIIKSKQMLCICAPHEMRLTVQSTVALLLKQ